MRSYLYISANPKKEEASNSLRVGRALTVAVRRLDPQAHIAEIDVYRQPIPLIDDRFLQARARLPREPTFRNCRRRSRRSSGMCFGTPTSLSPPMRTFSLIRYGTSGFPLC